MVTKEILVEIIDLIDAGLKIHNESWDAEAKEYKISEVEAIRQVAKDNDENIAYTLHLFAHWWNDLETMREELKKN